MIRVFYDAAIGGNGVFQEVAVKSPQWRGCEQLQRPVHLNCCRVTNHRQCYCQNLATAISNAKFKIVAFLSYFLLRRRYICLVSSYKHAIDGLWRVYKHEGFRSLFNGATTASTRASFMNVGQIAFYDQIKQMLLNTGSFHDNLTTHLLASITAVS